MMVSNPEKVFAVGENTNSGETPTAAKK